MGQEGNVELITFDKFLTSMKHFQYDDNDDKLKSMLCTSSGAVGYVLCTSSGAVGYVLLVICSDLVNKPLSGG